MGACYVRLKSLSIAGFRGFGERADFDLDADAVIIVGPNGGGKTSFFDAVLWALCGRVDRVKGGDEALLSMFAPTGRAEVSIELVNGSESLTVTRWFDGVDSNVTFA